jgi:mono/diheme cytochrome c family protein
MTPRLQLLTLVPALALMQGCGSNSSSTSSGSMTCKDDGTLKGTVERGQYLVDKLLVCGDCHTPSGADGKPDMKMYLAGSRNYDFPYMGKVVSVYAENLTGHLTEGLCLWTNDEVRRAITVGIDDEKVSMWPIMPYPLYARLKPEDLDSIIKYLRTIPPNPNPVPADSIADPDPPPPQAQDKDIPHTTLDPSDPSYAAAERGRYLAAVACLHCHTPNITPGVPDFTKAFSGGREYKVRLNSNTPSPMSFTSTNLTPDATGLAGWSIDDFVQAMKTNKEKGTGRSLCGTMPSGPGKMGDLTDGDLTDLATYFHNLAPIKNGPFMCQ